MRKLQYILFLLILFLCPKVFAATYNVSSKVEAIPNFGGGTYGGYAKGLALPTYYNINTRYNGQLAIIDFYLDSDDWDWNYNKTYTITLNMATEDWRNNFMGPQVFNAQSNGTTTGSNLYVSNTFRFISKKQIKFNFKLSSTMGPYLKFRLYSTNTNTTNITGVNNWNLSSISISTVSATPSPPPVTPTPTPTASSGASNQDIINNNNTNTENIINNNNTNTENIIDNNTQNTTDIINNNNSNTQDIIDNQNKNIDSINQQLGVCHTNIFDKNNFNSSVVGFKLSGLTSGKEYKFYSSSDFSWFKISTHETGSGYFEYYGNNKKILTFTAPNNVNDYYLFLGDSTNWSNNSLWFYNNANLMLFSSPFPNDNIDFISYNEKICTSKLDDTNNAINQQNEYLMDNSNPNISDNEFLNTFNSVGINDPLSYLLTLPTQLINKIVSLSDSCTSINLGTLYGVMLTLPCINIENILGSSVWNIIDVIFSVSLLVVILKNLYDTFSNLLTMGAEKEAKEKFSMPTPMDFLSMILGGDR